MLLYYVIFYFYEQRISFSNRLLLNEKLCRLLRFFSRFSRDRLLFFSLSFSLSRLFSRERDRPMVPKLSPGAALRKRLGRPKATQSKIKDPFEELRL